MKKNIIVLIFAGTVGLSLCACGNKEIESFDNTAETEVIEESEETEEEEEGQAQNLIVDDLEEMLLSTEDEADSLEDSIMNDLLSQMEYDEKTKQLYELWDSALNKVWEALEQTQDEETMSSLIAEEREWVALKEQEVAEAGAEYEGGSIQAMVMNQKAAEMTKARVYKLMELFQN